MRPKDADKIANIVDPDQASLSLSALLIQTCLYRNLGSKQKVEKILKWTMKNFVT